MKMLLCGSVKFTDEQAARIAALGFDIVRVENERQRCSESMLDAQAVVGFQFFNYNDISLFKNLRVIHTTSAGLDHMPLDYIRQNGIVLYNAGGVYSVPIAEFVLCGVLELYKQAPRFRRQQTAHVWKQTGRLLELTGRNVCIVGAGSIGTECARRFSAMGCRVTGICRHPEPKPGFDRVLSVRELDAALSESDVTVLTLPLTDETRHMFDAERFEHMKPGSVLVNVGRGGLCRTEALTGALKSGRLGGAVLDVFETEPLPEQSELWDMDNVIVTPHNSFCGNLNSQRMTDLICANLKSFMENAGRQH